jgi:hypothetical protein
MVELDGTTEVGVLAPSDGEGSLRHVLPERPCRLHTESCVDDVVHLREDRPGEDPLVQVCLERGPEHLVMTIIAVE